MGSRLGKALVANIGAVYAADAVAVLDVVAEEDVLFRQRMFLSAADAAVADAAVAVAAEMDVLFRRGFPGTMFSS